MRKKLLLYVEDCHVRLFVELIKYSRSGEMIRTTVIRSSPTRFTITPLISLIKGETQKLQLHNKEQKHE